MAAGFLLPERPLGTLADWLALGGGDGLRAARRLGPEGTIDEIRASGLRGRGGGGFPTGAKWAGVAAGRGTHHYLVTNAAEGEPGTFKDRRLMRDNPYQLVEGVAIAAFAVGATEAFIGLKASFTTEIDRLTRALADMTAAGLAGDVPIQIVPGPEEYLLGEEKALLEVIEGKDPLPRLLPPYELGLFANDVAIGWEAGSRPVAGRSDSNPTVVNNVESLASAAHIMANGSEWFRSMGTRESPGTVIATVVGDVRVPGVHEVEMGTPFSALLELCGGPLPGRTYKAAFSGVSNPVLPADAFDTLLTYEDFAARGAGLGAAGFVVYDDSVNMTLVAAELSRFLSIESCGQCPPCKQGSLSITAMLASICNREAGDEVLGELANRLRSVTDANRCFLGTEEQVVVSSILREFPDDVAAFLENRPALNREVQVPLIKEIHPGGIVDLGT
ncbi:MAG TPA: NADH-ubiquinone oxidoreductase-F iron-sulfur binding region domain-containing protein [Ilumatobacteraceae bacterium]